MVAPFIKIITKNRLVIILAAIVLILVIAVIGYWIYKSATKSISENFSVNVDDLDGTNAKTKIYFTKGLDEAINKVSEIFGTIPDAEVFEDKLPGVCLDEDTICKGIKDPLKLPVKQDSDISGCGWYFAEDDDKVSFPAYGTKDGPLNPIMQKRAQGGQWYFKNLDEAQVAEDTKRCNRIKSCNIADLYPNQCAWCDTLGKAVPFDPDSRRSKYPDIDTISCNGRLVQDTANCKLSNKKTAVKNDKGQLSNTEAILKDICTLTDGKLPRNCLAYIAKTAGVKETGKIAKIINNDPEKYLQTGTESNRELMIVLNTLKRIDRLHWNFEFFGNGNCKRKDVISYYVNLVDLVTFGKTEESRSAAAWLVYGLPINFDLCTDKMLGPYTLTFVQRLFKKSGGQASGTSYPKEQDMHLYIGKKCTDIAMAFQKLCKEDTVSPDFQTRVKASLKCLGVQINSPNDPNSPNNPNNPSNINNTSGINITTPAPYIPGCSGDAPPAAVVPNPYRFADPSAITGQNEVFHVSGYTNHYWNADSKCSEYNGAKQATKQQLTDSWNAGADWCSSGWVMDFHNPLYPSNVQLGVGCGNGKPQITEFMPPTNLAGVNCYGIKPVNGKYPEIKDFTPGVWYQRDYVKPTSVGVPGNSDLKICLAGISYYKLGEFKLAYLDNTTCDGINNSNYAKGGYIFVGDKSDWTKIGNNTRNEAWQHIKLNATDLKGVNVIDKVKPVADKLNIPDRIQQENPPFINYYLKHKTQNSSVVFNKCGYINGGGCNDGTIIGMYKENNWARNSDPRYKQYVVDMITGGPAPVGIPLFSDNDVYELYFAITTDINCVPSSVVPGSTLLPNVCVPTQISNKVDNTTGGKPSYVTLTGPSCVYTNQDFSVQASLDSGAGTGYWALNGTINRGCLNPGCGFKAPSTPGMANVTYSFSNIVGTLQIIVIEAPPQQSQPPAPASESTLVCPPSMTPTIVNPNKSLLCLSQLSSEDKNPNSPGLLMTMNGIDWFVPNIPGRKEKQRAFVAKLNNTYYISGVWEKQVLYSSTDCKNWQPVGPTIDKFNNAVISLVAYDNKLFLGVYDVGRFVSCDGINWTKTSDDGGTQPIVLNGKLLHGGGGGWGSSVKQMDTNYKEIKASQSLGSGGYFTINDIAYDSDKNTYLAACQQQGDDGSKKLLFWSDDLVNWTPATGKWHIGKYSSFWNLTKAFGKWWTNGSDATLLMCSDDAGRSWYEVKPPANSYGSIFKMGGTLFYWGSDDPANMFYSTTDGVNWVKNTNINSLMNNGFLSRVCII